MHLLNGKREIPVRDIQALISIGFELFPEPETGKTVMPVRIRKGTIFLLRDGSLHFSNQEPDWIKMQILAER
ncbi:MAG: hypothetical protein KHW59_07770 [Clostridiales bacterium]|nr:hypothetical protein [Clostridiales bacterium]